MVISLTASWIRWCMQVYACELMWTCIVWTERSTPDNFGVPSHRFNSAIGKQKGITQTIYTDSEPPSRMPNSLMPNAKLRSANLPFFYILGVTRSGIEPWPPAPRADTNHYATRGRYYLIITYGLNPLLYEIWLRNPRELCVSKTWEYIFIFPQWIYHNIITFQYWTCTHIYNPEMEKIQLTLPPDSTFHVRAFDCVTWYC